MNRKAFIPISALLGALLLALVAAMTLFVAEPDRAHAQTPTGLSSLSVGGNRIAISGADGATPTYDHTSDIIRVSSGTSSIGVSATPRTSTSRVEVRYGSTVSGGASVAFPEDGTVATGSVPLVAGASTNIAVIVKPADATVTTGTVHVVTVRRVPTGASSDAKLAAAAGLALSTGTLVPGYDQDTTSYRAFFPNDVDDTGGDTTTDITLTTALSGPTSGDDQATLEVTSNKGADKVNTTTANTTHIVTLDEGMNVITVLVKAANVSTTKTYTLTLSRAAANASDNAELSSLTVGGSSVDLFTPTANADVATATAGYTTRVPNGTASITIGANTAHPRATVILKSSTTDAPTAAGDSGTIATGNTVDLSEGQNYIAVQVTAEDGTAANRKFYIIEVTRAGAGFSNDADLESLTVAGGTDSIAVGSNITLVPPARGSTNYMVFVPFGVDSDTAADGNQITVTATGFDNTETGADDLDMANVRVSAETIADDTTPASNVATHLVTLGTGTTVVTITVESADATRTKTYTLTVRRAAINGLDDARLSALMVGDTSVELGGFTPTNRTETAAVGYMTRVPNTTSSIQITPTTMDSGAVAIIKSGTDAAASVAATATVHPGGNVALTEGNTTAIAVQVTAANGTTELNYVVSVERVLQGVSNATDLSSLMVTENATSPATTFLAALVSGTTDYMIAVPNDVDGTGATNDEILITAAPATGGMVMVTSDNDDVVAAGDNANEYVVELVEGANVITIVSEAANAVDTKTYTLTVTRAASTASDDAGLSELTVYATGDATMVYRTATDPGAYLTNTVTDPVATAIVETGVANSVYDVQIMATLAHSGASAVIRTITSEAAPADAAAITAGTADADGVVDVIVGASNYVAVVVTAEDGVASATYLLKVNRARASADDGAKLTTLTTDIDPLTPAFDEDVMEYTAEVMNSVQSVTITSAIGGAAADTTAGALQGGAIVHIMSDSDDAEAYGVNTVTNHDIDLMVGANVITIMVTAADYETMNTYTVTITRAADESDATLSSLYLKHLPMNMMEGMAIELDPMFDSGTMAYSADAGSAEMITVTAKAAHPDADVSVMVNGTAAMMTDIPMYWDMLGCPAMNDSVRMYDDHSHPDNATSPYCTTYHMDATHPGLMGNAKDVVDMTFADYYDVPLMMGDNTITVMVTSEDETMMETYTITVTREDTGMPPGEAELRARYDANDDGMIDLNEVNDAIDEYFENPTSEALEMVLDVIDLYFADLARA